MNSSSTAFSQKLQSLLAIAATLTPAQRTIAVQLLQAPAGETDNPSEMATAVDESSLYDREMTSKRQKKCNLVEVTANGFDGDIVHSIDEGDSKIVNCLLSSPYHYDFELDENNQIEELMMEFGNDGDLDRELFEKLSKLPELRKLRLRLERSRGTTSQPSVPSPKSITSSIGLFQNLETLDISENSVAYLPEEMVNLVNLERLDVSNTKLTSFTFLRNMNKLQELRANWIGNLNIIPNAILNLTSLRQVSLTGNDLEHIPEEIGNLINLEKLSLAGNPIISLPASIGNLKKMQGLSLSHTKIKKFPKEFGDLSALSSLDLSECFVIRRIPKVFGRLINLKSLSMDYSFSLYSIPSSIGNLTQLETLSLCNTEIQVLPAEIGKMTNLQSFTLSESWVSHIPQQIGNLVNLKDLSFWNNSITSLPASIGNLVNLKDLCFWNNSITSLPASIGNLENLECLSLGKNKISVLPCSIGNLKKLESLDISDTEITKLPCSIGNLKKLESLNICDTLITKLPNEFWNLRDLERLSASSASLLIPPSIERLQNLKHLELTIEGKLPKEFGNLRSLTDLEIHGDNTQFLPFAVENLQQLRVLHLTGVTGSFSIRQLDFVRKLPNLESLYVSKYNDSGFDVNDVEHQEEIEFILDLVQGCPRLVWMGPTLEEKLPDLSYFLGCNRFHLETSALFSNTKTPLNKLWPKILPNADHAFGSFKSKIKKHDAAFKLLSEGMESFVQVLLDRSCKTSSDSSIMNSDSDNRSELN